MRTEDIVFILGGGLAVWIVTRVIKDWKKLKESRIPKDDRHWKHWRVSTVWAAIAAVLLTTALISRLLHMH